MSKVTPKGYTGTRSEIDRDDLGTRKVLDVRDEMRVAPFEDARQRQIFQSSKYALVEGDVTGSLLDYLTNSAGGKR